MIKQLRFENINGNIRYINIDKYAILDFDIENNLTLASQPEGTRLIYKGLIYDAEKKYLEFLKNDDQVLTLKTI